MQDGSGERVARLGQQIALLKVLHSWRRSAATGQRVFRRGAAEAQARHRRLCRSRRSRRRVLRSSAAPFFRAARRRRRQSRPTSDRACGRCRRQAADNRSARRLRQGRRQMRRAMLRRLSPASDSDEQKAERLAPLAARSDRFIRSALRPMASGRIVGKDMHAGDDAVGRQHEVAAGRRRRATAASSPRPRAPGCLASGRK